MPPPHKKKRFGDNKLDNLLRQGAANKQVDIDKAILSSTDRLLKERIVFTKSNEAFDSIADFKSGNIIVLDPADEAAAREKSEKQAKVERSKEKTVTRTKPKTPTKKHSKKSKKQ